MDKSILKKFAIESRQDLMDKITIQSDILNNYIVANYDGVIVKGEKVNIA